MSESDKRSRGSMEAAMKVNDGQGQQVQDRQELSAVETVLQLNEMLSQILKYLPTKDVKSCSSLNSVFRKEARKILVKRTQVKFIEFEDQLEKLQEYMVIMDKDCHRTVSFGLVGCLTNNLVVAFGNKYGNQIQELSLVMSVGDFNSSILAAFPHVGTLTVSLKDARDVTPGSIPEGFVLKNVKSLTVKVIPGAASKASMSVARGLLGGFAKSLLLICPSLEQLTLHDETQHAFLTQWPKADDDKSRISKTITHLTMTGVDAMFDSLRSSQLIMDLPFNLTVLEIDLFRHQGKALITDSSWSYWLQGVLFKFAPTLRHLGLHRVICDKPSGRGGAEATSVLFPRMVNLETLEITHHVRTQKHKGSPLLKFTFESGPVLIYIQQFPALKKLSIKQVQCGSGSFGISDAYSNVKGSLDFCDMFFPKGTPACLSLQHIYVDCLLLRQPRWNCQCREFCFCLKRLRLKYNYDILGRMMAVFPNAEELKNLTES